MTDKDGDDNSVTELMLHHKILELMKAQRYFLRKDKSNWRNTFDSDDCLF